MAGVKAQLEQLSRRGMWAKLRPPTQDEAELTHNLLLSIRND